MRSSEIFTLTTFLISLKSAVALTRRSLGFCTSKIMIALDGSSAPRQRLGLNALIGVSASRSLPSGMIGPAADRLYAVEPAGVATITPSHIISSIRGTPSTMILILAA